MLKYVARIKAQYHTVPKQGDTKPAETAEPAGAISPHGNGHKGNRAQQNMDNRAKISRSEYSDIGRWHLQVRSEQIKITGSLNTYPISKTA